MYPNNIAKCYFFRHSQTYFQFQQKSEYYDHKYVLYSDICMIKNDFLVYKYMLPPYNTLIQE